MNKLIITGRLTRDSEYRVTSNGTSVLSFTVANNTGFGENEKTHYFECAIFGKRADGRLKEYMLKGKQVVVEGEISLNQYEKKDGTGGANLKVFVNNIELMGGGQQASAQPAIEKPNEDDDLPFSSAQPAIEKPKDDDDDIPF